MDQQLLDIIARSSAIFENMLLVPLYLVTMTICYKTSFSIANVNLLSEKFTAAACLCNANVTNLRQFRNCIILKMKQGGSNLSAKIFINGTIHLTGAKAFSDADLAVRSLCSVLTIVYDENIVIKDMTIQMINVCLKLNFQLHMDKAFAALQNNTSLVFYNKEKYPGMKIKSSAKSPSILVFKSGSIIISGCKQIDDVLVSSKMLVDLMKTSNMSEWVFT